MPRRLENKVVISTSIVVDFEAGETGNSSRLQAIVSHFQRSVADAFSRDATVQPTGNIAFDWLDDADTNFGRCVDCNRIVSDCEKPNNVRCLIEAKTINGELLCLECAYHGRVFGPDST